MGIPLGMRTKYYSTNYVGPDSNPVTKIVIVGPKEWVSSPLLMSIYAYVLRLTSHEHTKKPKTLNQLLDSARSSDTIGNDSSFLSSVSNAAIIKLLINYKTVLEDNPLTGFNDARLYSEAKESSENLQDMPNPLPDKLEKYYVGRYSLSFCPVSFHSKNGFATMFGKVRFIEGDHQVYEPYGLGWAVNFSNLDN